VLDRTIGAQLEKCVNDDVSVAGFVVLLEAQQARGSSITGNRRGVQQPQPIAKRRRDPRQMADDETDLRCQRRTFER
jgi:hypothetical protein